MKTYNEFDDDWMFTFKCFMQANCIIHTLNLLLY